MVLGSTALDSREGSVREFNQETERERKGRRERGEEEGGGGREGEREMN